MSSSQDIIDAARLKGIKARLDGRLRATYQRGDVSKYAALVDDAAQACLAIEKIASEKCEETALALISLCSVQDAIEQSMIENGDPEDVALHLKNAMENLLLQDDPEIAEAVDSLLTPKDTLGGKQ